MAANKRRKMHHLILRFMSTSASGTKTTILEANTKVQHLISYGLYAQALVFYKEQLHPLHANTTTNFILPSIIKACAHSQTHQSSGLQIHCNVLKNGFDSESTVSNSLISMYAKFSDTKSAHKLFDTMPCRDTISWNSMINSYIQNGFFLVSLKMFKEMYVHGCVPKPELIASVFSACVKSETWRLGRVIHALVIVDERIEKSVFVVSALVDFYWRCGDSDMAFRVFDSMEEKNEVSWTAMISGCVGDRDYMKALDLFCEMQENNIKPNRVTVISILPVFAELGSIKRGKEIHGYAFRHGFDSDARFSTALVHVYSECGGALQHAKLVFDMCARKDVVMWSAMIAGYSHSKDCTREAIRLFSEMQMEGILPNSVTLLAMISACTNLLSLSNSCGIHGYTLKCGLNSNLFIQNALINMYSKCGSLEDSVQVFKEMRTRDSVSWSAIISAYGLYGYPEEALRLFYEMQGSSIKADAITYLAILSACNHAGFVEEGLMLFEEAIKDINISLTTEHYTCFIDLLGRAGKLDAAHDVVGILPTIANARIYSSLVSACKLHGRLDVAGLLAHKLVRSEPENAANHALLSMVNAESDNWLGVEEVWRDMKDRKIKKNYGFSKIELTLVQVSNGLGQAGHHRPGTAQPPAPISAHI
ncbi:Tetratricopeptide repeat (TPR)-like superfamily protein [Forsythia ovata]|uniref:Tetratricopeptide repeat (TPR)-like superfamily protein n=1 Tax=Forsythia ovata TaxID=205694 RepID=A0ABD1X015_9LAMI